MVLLTLDSGAYSVPAHLAYIYKLSCFAEISLHTTPAFAKILLNPYVELSCQSVVGALRDWYLYADADKDTDEDDDECKV